MKFKFAAVALLVSATLFCSESFGTDLLGRVLSRGCCGSQASSCETDCGCEAAPVVEDCGCGEVVEDCGCGSRSGLLSRLGNRERRGVLCGCGPTCPEEAAAPCCEAAPVVEECGCEEAAPACADPCEKRVGLLNKLMARCKGRSCGGGGDCGCEVMEEAPCCEPAPVMESCGCEMEAAPACGDSCGERGCLLSKLRARCKGGSCGAPAADCGCGMEVVEEAPCCEPGPAPAPCCEPAPEPAPAPCCEAAPAVEDCGCAMEAAPACADPCEKRVGLLSKLMARCGNRGSCGAAADCGCEAAPEPAPCCEPAPEPAPAPCCDPAPVMEACGGCEAEPSCGCDAAASCGGGQLRSRLAARPKLRGRCGKSACGASSGCGCGAPAASSCGCDSGCDSGCGSGNGCSRLSLLDRLRGNRLPRDRATNRVLCGCPNDGCNPPCPGGSDAPVVESGCSSCGGGEIISYGDPIDGGMVPVQQATPSEGIIVPADSGTEGVIIPGGGSATKAPVVRPDAFVIRAAK